MHIPAILLEDLGSTIIAGHFYESYNNYDNNLEAKLQQFYIYFTNFITKLLKIKHYTIPV